VDASRYAVAIKDHRWCVARGDPHWPDLSVLPAESCLDDDELAAQPREISSLLAVCGRCRSRRAGVLFSMMAWLAKPAGEPRLLNKKFFACGVCVFYLFGFEDAALALPTPKRSKDGELISRHPSSNEIASLRDKLRFLRARSAL
jgi:hypothetical protein